jgi:glutamine---fructose-6-phosphate transaminase (isomerizing)
MSDYGALISAECRQAPDVVRRQSGALAQPLSDLVRLLRNRAPQVVVTCARGSSAHAATFGKYLIERYLGVPVAEAAPSITSVYRKDLRLDGQLFLAISQSGRSEDLIESAASAKASGALTAAIVNDTDSPLASTCDIVLPMAAGPELSVAATKTFIASLGALLNLVAVWTEDRLIKSALDRLPARLRCRPRLVESVQLTLHVRDSGHVGPRSHARYRPRGILEAEGSLQHSR